MSVTSEITRLQNAKASLKTAIEGKGVTVSSSAKLDAYPALVESIEAGGGGDGVYKSVSLTGKGTTSDNPFVIQLEEIPTFIEVIEKNDRPEYFCFERVSNGKRTQTFPAQDERQHFYRPQTQVGSDYIYSIVTRTSQPFT